MKRKSSRAEITSTQIVGLVLLILGFVIVLFLLQRFAIVGNIDRTVCHESVVLRGTVPSLVKNYVNLNCKTKKVCASDNLFGKGDCDAFAKSENIVKAKVSDKDDVERMISREVLECWNIMGEGKMSLFSSGLASFGIGGVYPTCVICSRIDFEEGLEEKIDLANVDVLDYMNKHQAPNKEVSYLEAIIGEGSVSDSGLDVDFEKISDVEFDGKKVGDAVTEVAQNPEKNKGTEELAVLFMQISAPSGKEVLKNLGTAGIIAGGIIAFSPLRGAAGKVVEVAVANPLATFILVGLGGAVVAGTTIYNGHVTAGKCGDVVIGGEAGEGCSVVRVVNYNVSEIKKYCSVIEGIA
jgi:hypothetical protein